MTVSNVSNATSGVITQAPGNPGALQRSHSLPSARTDQNAYRRLLPRSDSFPARITQNSPESLRAPIAGKVLFRALEESGASSSKVRHVFDIVESGSEAGEKSYQITMSDGLRDSVTMKLKMPEGESLESVREKLGAGEYKVKIVHNSEGEQVCQLRENIGLKGGGAKVSKPNNDGRTPLHIAALHGDIDAINALTKAGAVVDKPNEYGETPLDIAKEKGHAEIVRILSNHEAPASTTSVSSTSNQPSTPPAQPDQQKIELTPEQIRQVAALLGHAQVIDLLGNAIDIDDAIKNGGLKVSNQNEHKEIMDALDQVKVLQQKQDALRSEFEKIMGDHPKDLTEPQQKYFHAFLGAMQHFFIVSNAISSQKIQTKVEVDTSIEVLGVAAEQASEVIAAGLPVAGVVFKGAAWLISQLLENRLINHMSPFAKLFQTPNQCAVVAHALAEQLARIREPKIQSAYIKDTTVSTTLAQRCKAVFEKYHIQTKEPDKVDKLAMKDVQKLVKRIYSFEQGKNPVTVNGTAYGYKDLQKDIGSDDGRRQVIDPLLNLMGWSVPVQTGSAPQNTSQNSHQHQNRDEAGPSTQLTQEQLERLRELDSKFAGIDAEKLQQLLNQQQKAPSSYERLMANGQQQVYALAEEHLRAPAHSSGASASLLKEFLEYQELTNLLATKVALLEEAIGNMSPSSSNLQPRINTEPDYDSGVDGDEVRYGTNANRLAFWIQKNDMDEIQEIIQRDPSAPHEAITRKPGKEHMLSNAMDIAAREGHPGTVRMLRDNYHVQPMRIEKRMSAEDALYEAKQVAKGKTPQS